MGLQIFNITVGATAFTDGSLWTGGCICRGPTAFSPFAANARWTGVDSIWPGNRGAWCTVGFAKFLIIYSIILLNIYSVPHNLIIIGIIIVFGCEVFVFTPTSRANGLEWVWVIFHLKLARRMFLGMRVMMLTLAMGLQTHLMVETTEHHG